MSESMAEWERELLASQPDRMRFSRKWTSSDGDTRCQRCGQDNPPWFAPNEIWNNVNPQWNILCPTCFVEIADDVMRPTAWQLTPVRWVQSAPSAPATAPLTPDQPPADHGDGSGAARNPS